MIEKKQQIGYHVVRSDRRTLSISVDPKGEVTVRAPLRATDAEIRSFVTEKAGWILRAQQKQQEKRELAPTFAVGGSLPYLGGQLQLRTGSVAKATLNGSILTLPQTGIPQNHVLRWLGDRAREYLLPRVQYWSGVMGLTPSSLTIANPKTRWGSMKSDGSMRLNVALMHCPPALIDYVIVHELSHMVHMNHSPAFHAHVAGYLPDAEARRKALKQLGGYLTMLRGE